MHNSLSVSLRTWLCAFAFVVALAPVLTTDVLAETSGEPYAGKLAFDVLRGGKQIGRHEITFTEIGDETHVSIDIELVVKIGFLTVFRYEHQNREVWRNGRVVSVMTDTNDDGKPFELRAIQGSEGLHVKTLSDEAVVPSSAIPTSYWNPEILRNRQWLDTQRGVMLDIEVGNVGIEPVELADGRTIEAERFEVTGDLNISVWYTPQGEWVKLAFPARGSDIEYVLTEGYTGTRLSLAQ